MTLLESTTARHITPSFIILKREVHSSVLEKQLKIFNPTRRRFFFFGRGVCVGFWEKNNNRFFSEYSLDWADNFFLRLQSADSADGFSFVGDSALDARAGMLVHPCTDGLRVPEVGLQRDHFMLWDLLSWWVTLGQTLERDFRLVKFVLCLIVCMCVQNYCISLQFIFTLHFLSFKSTTG